MRLDGQITTDADHVRVSPLGRVGPDEVLIVAGTAQALALLHPLLRGDGIHAVAVEDPGSLGTRQHLQNAGLATPPVPVDDDGVRTDVLDATGARAVLLTPAHQFPTGVVTSGERRRELLVLARLMESGGLERHLRLLRGRHRRRRDAMIDALTEHLPGAVVYGAAAGLHLTVTYAPEVPDTELAATALARGVKCQPLSWHRQLTGRPGGRPPGFDRGPTSGAP